MAARVRSGKWHTVAEFKKAIRDAWDSISLEEVRKRVREMPTRCEKMIQLEGRRYRSKLW
jgi:endonuclease/exonuclease/phosphatase family metal-dependent hydrolase